MKMQDISLRLTGTEVIELPVIRGLNTRASKGISREGTLSFWRPEIPKTCSRAMCEAQAIFISRGADLGVNRQGM